MQREGGRGRFFNNSNGVNHRQHRNQPRQRDSFAVAVRIIYKMAQALHHLGVLKQRNVPPKGITRQAKILTHFVKPANPSQETVKKLASNAETWAKQTRQILIEHYQNSLECLEDEYREGQPTDRVQEADAKALIWNKKNLGEKFKIRMEDLRSRVMNLTSETGPEQNCLRDCQARKSATVTSNVAVHIPQDLFTISQENQIEQPRTVWANSRPVPVQSAPHSAPLRPVPRGRAAQGSAPASPDITPPTTPVRPPISPQIVVSRPQQPAPDQPASPAREPQAHFRSAADTGSEDWTRPPRSESPSASAHIDRSLSSRQGTHGPLPQRPRAERRPSRGQTQRTTGTAGQEVTTAVPQVIRSGTATPSLTPTVPTPTHGVPAPRVRPTRSCTQQQRTPDTVSNSQDDFQQHTRRGSGKRLTEVTRHPHTSQKNVTWKLQPSKPVLIIGDSNIARVHKFSNNNIQLDSYPGAKCTHGTSILDKLNQCPETQKVILSFGINHKEQRPQTAIKQLQTLIKMARGKFPNASIWIPMINFSQSLPAPEQDTLRQLNDYIHTKKHIPTIPTCQFKVVADHVHWTEPTARAIIREWMKHLNC